MKGAPLPERHLRRSLSNQHQVPRQLFTPLRLLQTGCFQASLSLCFCPCFGGSDAETLVVNFSCSLISKQLNSCMLRLAGGFLSRDTKPWGMQLALRGGWLAMIGDRPEE